MAPDGNCGRMVGYGEVSSEPDHDDPARDPSFRIGGNPTATKQIPHRTVMLSEAKHLAVDPCPEVTYTKGLLPPRVFSWNSS